jgi:hypothetical protein
MSKSDIRLAAEDIQQLINSSPRSPTTEQIEKVLVEHFGENPCGFDKERHKEQILCSRVWEKFYDLWKDVTHATSHMWLVLPVWLTSEYMMRRHPRFFLNSRMMYGPASLVARKDGHKVCVAATRELIGSYGVPAKSFTNGFLEDIQDTKACLNGILGYILNKTVNAHCDKLAEKWDAIIDEGGMVYPYAPLMMHSDNEKYWENEVKFSSRYGYLLKKEYNP